MYCKVCGYLLNENELTCKKCGTSAYTHPIASDEESLAEHKKSGELIGRNGDRAAGEKLDFKWNVQEFPREVRITEDIDFDWSIKKERHKTSRKTRIFAREEFGESAALGTTGPLADILSDPQGETQGIDETEEIDQTKIEPEKTADKESAVGFDIWGAADDEKDYNAKIETAFESIEDNNANDSLMREHEIAETEMAEAEIAEPEIAEPEMAEPEIAEPEIAELEMAEPEIAEPEMAEPEIAEPEIEEPDTAAEVGPYHQEAQPEESIALSLESLVGSRDEANDRFFTFNRKNEEFQRLLDQEYQKIKNFNNPRLRAVDALLNQNSGERKGASWQESGIVTAISDDGAAQTADAVPREATDSATQAKVTGRQADVVATTPAYAVTPTENVVQTTAADAVPQEAADSATQAAEPNMQTDDAMAMSTGEVVKTADAAPPESDDSATQAAGPNLQTESATALSINADTQQTDSKPGSDNLSTERSSDRESKSATVEIDWLDEQTYAEDKASQIDSVRDEPAFTEEETDASESEPASDPDSAEESNSVKSGIAVKETSSVEETFDALEKEKEKLEKKQQSKKSIGSFIITVIFILIIAAICMLLIWKYAPNSLGAYFIDKIIGRIDGSISVT